MPGAASRKLKDEFSGIGPQNKAQGQGNRFYSDSEIDFFTQQLKVNSEMVGLAVKQAGIKLHPRVAAAKAKIK